MAPAPATLLAPIAVASTNAAPVPASAPSPNAEFVATRCVSPWAGWANTPGAVSVVPVAPCENALCGVNNAPIAITPTATKKKFVYVFIVNFIFRLRMVLTYERGGYENL